MRLVFRDRLTNKSRTMRQKWIKESRNPVHRFLGARDSQTFWVPVSREWPRVLLWCVDKWTDDTFTSCSQASIITQQCTQPLAESLLTIALAGTVGDRQSLPNSALSELIVTLTVEVLSSRWSWVDNVHYSDSQWWRRYCCRTSPKIIYCTISKQKWRFLNQR